MLLEQLLFTNKTEKRFYPLPVCRDKSRKHPSPMLSEVFASSTVPEYQDCLTTCLRAEGLDVHPQVTMSFSDNVVRRLPHVAAWFTEANPPPGLNRDINRIVNQNGSNTVYIIREDKSTSILNFLIFEFSLTAFSPSPNFPR